jgi:imidazolonepropionase-like amidohydrolase
VAAGAPADLLLVEGDPLEDIGATAQIACVLRAGRVVARDCRGGDPACCL